jgi:hypothetical protein
MDAVARARPPGLVSVELTRRARMRAGPCGRSSSSTWPRRSGLARPSSLAGTCRPGRGRPSLTPMARRRRACAVGGDASGAGVLTTIVLGSMHQTNRPGRGGWGSLARARRLELTGGVQRELAHQGRQPELTHLAGFLSTQHLPRGNPRQSPFGTIGPAKSALPRVAEDPLGNNVPRAAYSSQQSRG